MCLDLNIKLKTTELPKKDREDSLSDVEIEGFLRYNTKSAINERKLIN